MHEVYVEKRIKAFSSNVQMCLVVFLLVASFFVCKDYGRGAWEPLFSLDFCLLCVKSPLKARFHFFFIISPTKKLKIKKNWFEIFFNEVGACGKYETIC